MTHLRQRANFNQLASAKNGDAVAERLHLAEDVRGQEHRLTARPCLRHTLAVHPLRGGLVVDWVKADRGVPQVGQDVPTTIVTLTSRLRALNLIRSIW